MSSNIKKEYSNGELTVVWQPDLCIHAGVCVKALPRVYKPKEKPWITIANATSQELIEQINKCPSGALSYYSKENIKVKSEIMETNIEVLKNGPLIVHGELKIKDTEGKETVKGITTAFCRCGSSNKKPYCDGTHSKVGFKD